MYILIIKTEGIRPYAVGLVISLQDFFIRLLVFKKGIGKGI